MRVVQKKIENENNMLYYEQFDSYHEFLNVVEKRDKENPHGEYTLSYSGKRGSWVGVKSYEEARNLLINGWDAKVEYFKKEFESETKKLDEKKVVKQFTDVVGFMPIVPNAIIGLPNCMINMRTEHKKTKVIKFLIDNTVSGSESSESLIKYYSKVLARIGVLEKNGYRCRIEILQTYTDERTSKIKAGFTVLVKSENQLFDIKRMAYPIAHTSMLRVFGFGWENSLPIDYNKYHHDGLGVPMYHWNNERRNNMLNAMRNQNEKIVYVCYNKDLEQIFEREVR